LNTQLTLTRNHKRHCRQSQQQSCGKKLVSFASLLAVSGTFNSLFKVLFTFPSRYFFAIGLESIFSFGRRSPPISAPIPKYATLRKPAVRTYYQRDGALTLSGAFFQKDLRWRTPWRSFYRLQFIASNDLQLELIRVHSPLLTESCSFSFPPLTYMLKFSG
jgi:hypothetical protein